MDLGLRGDALATITTACEVLSSHQPSASASDGNADSGEIELDFGQFLWMYAQVSGLAVPRASVEGLWVPDENSRWREVRTSL